MPTIRIDLFEGRTVEQKRALAAAITEACVRTIGSSPDSVVALCPRRTYDSPTSSSVCSFGCTVGTAEKTGRASSTVSSRTSWMFLPLKRISKVSRL